MFCCLDTEFATLKRKGSKFLTSRKYAWSHKMGSEKLHINRAKFSTISHKYYKQLRLVTTTLEDVISEDKCIYPQNFEFDIL